MNRLQIVVSGVLLIVLAWRTFVEVFAVFATQTPNDHPFSMASFHHHSPHRNPVGRLVVRCQLEEEKAGFVMMAESFGAI
jgi:hypothetical protein